MAASRVVPIGGKRAQQANQADGPRPNTINAAVSRGADSEGIGGGKHNPKKTQAREPKESSDDEVDREAKYGDVEDGVKRVSQICEGVLNYQTQGKRHFDISVLLWTCHPRLKRN